MRNNPWLQRRPSVRSASLAVLGMLLVMGCAQSPPPPRVMVPPADHGLTPPIRLEESPRPMPRDVYETQLPPPPFEDAPLVSQPTPEQSSFVDTYNRVGRPRIAVIVDRPNEDRNDTWARSFDDEAIRNVLTDWMACSGQVTMISSAPKDADQNADVMVKIQAHPT